MVDDELTEAVIGCAFTVHNKMGFGFEESVYQKCLCIELKKKNIQFESEKGIEVFYEHKSVGLFRADIVVENRMILELKSILALSKAHEAQLVNYLVATKIDTGLLINFGPEKVQVKRKARLLKNDY